MSNQDKTRYDVMIPFFGLKDDRRVRLYLAALENEWNRTGVVAFTDNADGKGARVGNIAEELKIKNFSRPDANGNTKGDEVHSEWKDFKANLASRLTNANKNTFNLGNNTTANDVLNVIRTQGGNRFFQAVIQAHLTIILDNAGNDITTLPLQWSLADNFIFRSAFDDIMPRSQFDGGNQMNAEPIFSFNFSKYLLYLRLENAATQPSKPNNFWSTEEPILDTYFRVKNRPNELLTIDENGNKVNVYDNKFLENKYRGDQCVGIKVKEGTHTCNNYLSKCIKSGKQEDIDSCKDYLKDQNFWDVVKSEVESMLPDAIVATLTTFGFKPDSKNKKYTSYESVGSWLSSLRSRIGTSLSQTDYDAIQKNTKLTQYLTILVNKVNQNPAILNKNYFNTNRFDPEDYSSRFNDWHITKYGLTPRVIYKKDNDSKLSINRQLAFVSNNILSLRNLSQNRIAFVPGSGLLVNGVAITPVTPFFLTGGAESSVDSLPVMTGGDVSELEHLEKQSPLIRLLVEQSINELRANGKEIDHQTQLELNDIVKSFESNENKLHKALNYVHKYIDLYNVYKQYDSDNVLSIDHIKSFVDARERYFDKTIKSLDGLDVLKQLADQVLEKLEK